MTKEHYNALMKAIKADGHRMRCDKKYALKVYVSLGMMTQKGNLTRPWKQIWTKYGIAPRLWIDTQRAQG